MALEHAIADLLHGQRAQRRFRRRLPHHRVAGNRREEGVPRPNRHRAVERGNHAHHAERMPLFVHAVLNALRMHGQAVQHARLSNRKIGDIDHFLDLAVAFGLDLAVLERDQAAQCVFVQAQFLTHQTDRLAAFRSRYLAPLPGGGHRSGHHMLIVVIRGGAHLRQALAGGGIDGIDERTGLLLAPAADAGPGARVEVAKAERLQCIGGLVHGEFGRILVGAAFCRSIAAMSKSLATINWHPATWGGLPATQQPKYADQTALERAVASLSRLPPLVVSWEIEALRDKLAKAQRGEQFLLQGGDCADSFEDCVSDNIARRLKILLQMSLVLLQGLKKLVIRVGRFAGQYAKPRSADTETRDGVTLPCYRGDNVNRPGFTAAEREPDPELLLRGYERASLTLNFVRALIDGGFADLHHPEYWDLSFLRHAPLRDEYQRIVDSIAESLEFFESMSGLRVHPATRGA